MKVLFVCTGNICRSPMGELMFPLFFHDDSIVTDSAGVQGLLNSPIDPASALLLAQDGIDSRAFRSKRLTPQLAMSNDLILCFTEHQRRKIVALAYQDLYTERICRIVRVLRRPWHHPRQHRG